MTSGQLLVIGGAGYIGSVLVPELTKEGYDVDVIDPRQAVKQVRESARHVIQADRRILWSTDQFDAVIDLAGIVGDPACAANPADAIFQNFDGLMTTLGRQVRHLIYASSCSIYGAVGDSSSYESDLANPLSLYAWTKVAAEQLIKESTVPATVLRLGTVFGLGPRMRWELVVNLLTKKAVEQDTITIFNGEQFRPFVHVYDVCRAIVLSLRDRLEGTYNVVGENLMLSQLATKIEQAVPATRIEYVDNDDRRNYRASSAAFRHKTGWMPMRTVAMGIREMADELRR